MSSRTWRRADWKIVTNVSDERSVSIFGKENQSTRHHISEFSNLHSYRCENLKSEINWFRIGAL
jgi:hypothetical protein